MDLLLKFASVYYASASKDIQAWFENNLPPIIFKYIVEPCQIKACGTVSQKIVDAAVIAGFNAYVDDSLGHAVAVIETDDGEYRVDATYLQRLFPFHGSLRDFSPEERDSEEYHKMKKLFEVLKKHPERAFKIEFSPK